jgi:hypothetical protein
VWKWSRVMGWVGSRNVDGESVDWIWGVVSYGDGKGD